jgi:hypothetical protein
MHVTESLPAGPVAVLSATIEGRPRLWERHPEVLPTVLTCTPQTPRSGLP